MNASALGCALLVLAGCAVPPPEPVREPGVTDTIDPRFDAYLQETTKTLHFSGAALVMRDGKVLHAGGYGPATNGRANRADTKFHIGSITKQFTAAAILQLVERGLVKLDDPINLHLPPNYRGMKWSEVTIHHLLSHTSGTPDYAVTRDYYRLDRGFASPDTVDGMVREAMEKDLEFAPGSEYAYANLGYTLLGAVIEYRTKQSYDVYIRDHLLAPLGMTSSRIHVFGQRPAIDEARGSRWSEEKKAHGPDDVVALPVTAPDGGLITTLEDLVRWVHVLTGPDSTVLSSDSIQRMSRPQIAIGNGGPLDSMGYGLYVGDRLIGHGGLIEGFSSQFVFDRETRSLIVVFSNDAGGDPQQVVFGLLTLLLTPAT